MSIRWARSSCRRCWPWAASVCSAGPSRCPVNTARLRSPRNQGVLVLWPGRLHQCAAGRVGAVVFIAVFRPTVLPNRYASHSRPEIVFFFSLGNIGLMALQPGADPAARRFGALRAPAAGALLADLSAHPAVHDAHHHGIGPAQLLPGVPTDPSRWPSTTSTTGGPACSTAGTEAQLPQPGPAVGRSRPMASAALV